MNAPHGLRPAFLTLPLVVWCSLAAPRQTARAGRLRTRVFDSPQLARTIVTRRVRKGRASTLCFRPGGCRAEKQGGLRPTMFFERPDLVPPGECARVGGLQRLVAPLVCARNPDKRTSHEPASPHTIDASYSTRFVGVAGRGRDEVPTSPGALI